MKKTFSAAVAAICGIGIALTSIGCDNGTIKTKSELANIEEMKRNAQERNEMAQKDFYDFAERQFEANRSVSSEGLTYPEFQDKLIELAWNAYYTGDDSEGIDLLKECGLYDYAIEVVDKYELKEADEILALPSGTLSSRKVTEAFFSSLSTGDIVVCIGGGGSSWFFLKGFIPSYWKHAGMYDKTTGKVYSASDKTENSKGDGNVGYEKLSVPWLNASSVQAVRVNRRLDSNGNFIGSGEGALAEAKKYHDYDFSFGGGRYDKTRFYCSKLVWTAWLSQGYDLEPPSG